MGKSRGSEFIGVLDEGSEVKELAVEALDLSATGLPGHMELVVCGEHSGLTSLVSFDEVEAEGATGGSGTELVQDVRDDGLSRFGVAESPNAEGEIAAG